MWEFAHSWRNSNNHEHVISTMQMIQAKSLSFKLSETYQGLFDLLEFKDEIEHLELQFAVSFPVQNILLRFSEFNKNAGKVSCPNMKVLDLHFSWNPDNTIQIINQWCIQMMDKRRLTGHPLEECRIWWNSTRSGPTIIKG